jgi:hypothetical protein
MGVKLTQLEAVNLVRRLADGVTACKASIVKFKQGQRNSLYSTIRSIIKPYNDNKDILEHI